MAKAKKAVVRRRKPERKFAISTGVPLVLVGIRQVQHVRRFGLASEDQLDRMSQDFSGYSPELGDWKVQRLLPTYAPIAIGALMSKLMASRVNRGLNIPFVKF